MEPWDGPAAVAFTDGRVIGATLDRNGLRPGRWLETKRRLGRRSPPRPACSTSRPSNVAAQGPPAARQAVPGRPRARAGSSPTTRSSARSPTAQAVRRVVRRGRRRTSTTCPSAEPTPAPRRAAARAPARVRLPQEDLRVLLAPMAARRRGADRLDGQRPRARRALRQAPPLFSYFKQLFAQVTNPPIDPIREAIVMSLRVRRRRRGEPARPRRPSTRTSSHARQPILRNAELETLRQVDHRIFRAHTIDITWPRRATAPRACSTALDRHLRRGVEAVVEDGVNVLILSDRGVGAERVADPVAAGRRPPCTTTSCARARACRPASSIESGEPREVHHFASLIGYGAAAINPYLMFETVAELAPTGRVGDVDDRRGASARRQGASARACSR